LPPVAAPVHQRGFGLVFASDREIPGLAPAPPAAPADIRIHLRALPLWLEGAPRTTVHRAASEGSALAVWALGGGRGLLLDYADGTRFVVDGAGTEVWADWTGSATLEDTATYLLGPVAALLLRLRGCVPLHASAVRMDGGAVALAGPGGAGKSTLAAAFARLGRQVVADDVLAVDAAAAALVVHPAYPRVRLWPDSVEMLYGHGDALPLLTPNWDKRYLDVGEAADDFPADPLPLRAVYLLERRTAEEEHRIRPLPPREGLMKLIATTCATFLPDPALRELEFRVLARLAREVPLRAVTAPEGADALPELCRAILADAADV
jgi:hypothetical protein